MFRTVLALLLPAHGETPSVADYALPTFRFVDLLRPTAETRNTVALALGSVGALTVSGVPGYAAARDFSLKQLPGCIEAQTEHSREFILTSSGQTRRTIATTADSKESSPCHGGLSPLRTALDTTVSQLLATLDLSAEKPAKLTPYEGLQNIVANGMELEHFHAYDVPVEGEENASKTTMPFHTDDGLMIAMTVGLYTDENGVEIPAPPNAGLFLKLPHGAVVRADVPEHDVIVMVGSGGQDWLHDGPPMRACPHAMEVGSVSNPGAHRSWHGRMLLPPGDAKMPWGTTFLEYRAKGAREAEREHGSVGHEVALAAQPTLGVDAGASCPTDDGNPGIFCWMQRKCYDISGSNCTYPSAPACWSPSKDKFMNPGLMCQDCEIKCQSEPQANSNGFCLGDGIDMYMTGFAVQGQKDALCLTLLFESWLLDSPAKFVGGAIFVTLLGVLTELVSYCRREMHGKLEKGRKRDLVMIGMYALHLGLGYGCMLIAMTYSIELFICVLIGLAIGHACFNLAQPPAAIVEPCCQSQEEVGPDAADKKSTGGACCCLPTTRKPTLVPTISDHPALGAHVPLLTAESESAWRAIPTPRGEGNCCAMKEQMALQAPKESSCCAKEALGDLEDGAN